jgi:hypothetical protein
MEATSACCSSGEGTRFAEMPSVTIRTSKVAGMGFWPARVHAPVA